MPNGTSPEEWRPVVGFEGLYTVSDRGRVRSLRRTVIRGGRPQRVPGKIMRRTSQNPSGRHLIVVLSRGGKKHHRRVHVLVLEAFVGPRPPGLLGCHNDGNPHNCRVENLRWDTVSANLNDAVKHGKHAMANRVRCPRKHPLAAPNLVPSQRADGRRTCLACSRAATAIWNARKNGRTPLGLQQLSDIYYARIQAGLGDEPLPRGMAWTAGPAPRDPRWTSGSPARQAEL